MILVINFQVMELDNRLQQAVADMTKLQEEARIAVQFAQVAGKAPAPAVGAAGAAPAEAGSEAAAAAAAAAGAAVPLANGSSGELAANVRKSMGGVTGMLQNIGAQAPGYARMLADTANNYLMQAQQAQQGGVPGGGPGAMPPGGMSHAVGAGQEVMPGTPEHVPGMHMNLRPHGPQETELERKTRELQVGFWTRFQQEWQEGPCTCQGLGKGSSCLCCELVVCKHNFFLQEKLFGKSSCLSV